MPAFPVRACGDQNLKTDAFAAEIARESAGWKKVVDQAGLRLDNWNPGSGWPTMPAFCDPGRMKARLTHHLPPRGEDPHANTRHD